MTERRSVTVFDLDGTLTRRDTFLPFLFGVDRARTVLGLVRAVPWLAGSFVDRTMRDRAKATLLRAVFAGTDADSVRARGFDYAASMPDDEFNPKVIARLDGHLERDDLVVLASASLAVCVEPIARRLGVADVIATDLEQVDGCLTGEIRGQNVRGGEKLRRVVEYLGRPPDFAYGDSIDDQPLLSASAKGFQVTGRRVTGTGPPQGP